MSKLCELTGARPQFGNNVSHSNRKTRRKFLPNIQTIGFFSDTMKKEYRFNIAASVLKSVEKNDGIDKFLLNSSRDSELSKKALDLKNNLKVKSKG